MRKSTASQKEFASRLRSYILEFISVFLIIALNGTILIFVLTTLIDKNATVSEISLFCFIYLLFGCLISTSLVYFVKGRVYYNKVKTVCDAAGKVAKGDFDVRIPIYFEKPKSEMDYLAVNFNKMLTEITSLENMRNNFVADVSHEIKTPLSVIQGYADLLKTPGLSDEKRREYIRLLSEAIGTLTNLVTNILKLNKIENQGIVQNEKFSLDEQLRYCILSFEDKFEEKNISINVELEEIVLNSDKVLLEIVWKNLISNAIKYTGFGGEISVSLKKEKGKVQVAVEDNGCGMSPETVKHCFDKFYQGDTSHSQEGNGLGLALVKQVITMLNAEITVQSQLGKGTVFTVIL